MSHFEYIMVMVSIIQGLGLTLALRGISRLVRSAKREVAVVLWAVFLVFLYLQNWWAFWDMASVEEWNFIKFLFISLYVCIVYAMTELLLPMSAPQDTDWRVHYLAIRKWFCGLLVVLVFLGVTLSIYIVGVPLLHPYRIMQSMFLLMAILGWLTAGVGVHRWIAALMLVVLLASQVVFRLFPGLSG
jgi:hypothetical protein